MERAPVVFHAHKSGQEISQYPFFLRERVNEAGIVPIFVNIAVSIETAWYHKTVQQGYGILEVVVLFSLNDLRIKVLANNMPQ